MSGANGNGTRLWQWIAGILAGIVISGGSFAFGYTRVDERVTALEIRAAMTDANQASMVKALDRIEKSLDSVSAYIMGHAATAKP